MLFDCRLSVPASPAAAVGVYVTLTWQLAPATRVAPQLLVCAKRLLETLRPVMFSVESPLLVSVTACVVLVVPTCWLPNAREAAEKLAIGAMPVPLRVTVCGEVAVLSLIVAVPVYEARDVGVRMITI